MELQEPGGRRGEGNWNCRQRQGSRRPVGKHTLPDPQFWAIPVKHGGPGRTQSEGFRNRMLHASNSE